MLEELLSRNEGKTLEFKENAHSLPRILQTVIAFANTAGGTLLLGIRDGTKEVIGLVNVLQDEERIANTIADSVVPLLVPNFQFCSWRDRDVLIISVPHNPGPYYLKAKGEVEGTFIRLGSTNHLADVHTIADIRRLKEHTSFDQLPELKMTAEDLDLQLAQDLFTAAGKSITQTKAKSLELLVEYQAEIYPSKGALLLFGVDRESLFPDPIVRMVRFHGKTKGAAIDDKETRSPLPLILDEVLSFIQTYTSLGAVVRGTRREEMPQYIPMLVREAVINALVHADYSNKRSPTLVAIFDDRLEITNPGSLPMGLTLDTALSGVSQLRNKVLGRIFRELKLTEHWGSGLKRMVDTCLAETLPSPKFEELDQFFRITLYARTAERTALVAWQDAIIKYLRNNANINAITAQEIWQVSRRTTSQRLKEMRDKGLLIEVATGSRDPYKVFISPEHSN